MSDWLSCTPSWSTGGVAKKLRESVGLSQQELADHLDYTLTWVNNVETMRYVAVEDLRDYALGCGYQMEMRFVPEGGKEDA